MEGREVRIPPRLSLVLSGVLTHLVRNAIAHGIEPTKTRQSTGKVANGTIHVMATAGERGPTVVLEDDGRGLDVAAIADRAAQLGVQVEGKSRNSLSELVFLAGLTTSQDASTLAGRGVGLSAVREDLERVGYAVDVTSEAGQSTRFTIQPK